MSQKTAARARSASTKWAQVVGSNPHKMKSDERMQPACNTWRPVMSHRLLSESSRLFLAVACHLASSCSQSDEDSDGDRGRLELLHSSVGLAEVVIASASTSESIPSSEPVVDDDDSVVVVLVVHCVSGSGSSCTDAADAHAAG